MKDIADKFRIASPMLALLLGWFAIDTIYCESSAPKARLLTQEFAPGAPNSPASLVDWAAAAALRGDLIADIAMARAAPALVPGKAPPASPETAVARERALATARQSLSLAPHSSAMWLLVAMLQGQTPSRASDIAVLKMSYLTSAADMNLIPARLATLAASPALADGELRSLARSDIRLILTRRPDLKAAIANAYRGGSPDGKAYIDDVVRSLDPEFAASLP